MRLAAIASALAIVLCVAVFGAIFFQKASIPAPASTAAPTQAGVAGARPAARAPARGHAGLMQQSRCHRCLSGG
jgi:hypothetical protein